MSVRHVVLLSLRPTADLDGIAEALRGLPAQVEQIRSYEVLVDAGLAEGNASVAVIATFDDAEGWSAYSSHPAHVDVIERLIAPQREGRAAIQAIG